MYCHISLINAKEDYLEMLKQYGITIITCNRKTNFFSVPQQFNAIIVTVNYSRNSFIPGNHQYLSVFTRLGQDYQLPVITENNMITRIHSNIIYTQKNIVRTFFFIIYILKKLCCKKSPFFPQKGSVSLIKVFIRVDQCSNWW